MICTVFESESQSCAQSQLTFAASHNARLSLSPGIGLAANKAVKWSYRQWQAVTRNYRQLQEITGSYKKLQAVTCSYRQLQAVTRNYRQLQAVTGSYRLPLLSLVCSGALCLAMCNHRCQATAFLRLISSIWKPIVSIPHCATHWTSRYDWGRSTH